MFLTCIQIQLQMFSSATSLNPFISSSSSYVDLSPYIFHHQEPFLHHHQNQNPVSILPLHSETTCSQPITNSNNAILSSSSKQDIEVINREFLHQYGFGTSSSAEKRQPQRKKDRHSKIYTAQGLRDRRVRMSIQIARKFFDLQDLLGFNKASQTLEWLLTKSKKAINELSHNDNHLINNSTKSFDSICEESGELELEEEENITSKDHENKTKRMMKKKKKAAAANNLQFTAKELREKARARARERTRFKMLCNSKSNDSRINLDPTTHQNFNQSKSILLNQHHCHQHQQSASTNSYLRPCHHQAEEPNGSTIGGESILIKRKFKQSTMMGYQQNFILFKDPNCNNNFPNLHPNGDNNSAIAHSTLCAITSMNRSTGTQLHGKLWEAENSQ